MCHIYIEIDAFRYALESGHYGRAWRLYSRQTNRVIRAELDGVPVLVEAVVLPGTQPTGLADKIPDLEGMFREAQSTVEGTAKLVVEIFKRLDARGLGPDHLEIEFGIKFCTSGNILIAGASAEAAMTVRLLYEASGLDNRSGSDSSKLGTEARS